MDVVDELRGALGAERVLPAAAAAARAVSYWDQSPRQARALLRPRSTEEISRILKICHAHDQAVVTLGGLTGCVEGAISRPDQIAISLEAMNGLEDIDPVGRTVTVQAGMVLQSLQEAVAEQGLYFPLDLGARGSCTLGGNVATNAGGINVIRYGMMRELVLGLEAVLADGTVVSSMNHMLKNNAGYDLKHLFIGTEGTLGIVTRMVLRLYERPGSRNAAMVALADFDAVAGLLKDLQSRLGGQLSSYEVMWGDYFRAVTAPGWHRAPMAREHAYYVMLEAEGSDPDRDTALFLGVLEQAIEQGVVEDAVIPQSEAERRALWEVRENFEALLVEPPVFLYDVSLPIRNMDAYIREVQARVRRCWPEGFCQVLGHIGDGNLHLFIKADRPGEDLHAQANTLVYEPLRPYGGSISAEHGIGTEKRNCLSVSRSAAEIALMRRLKTALDPKGLLNPGVIIPD